MFIQQTFIGQLLSTEGVLSAGSADICPSHLSTLKEFSLMGRQIVQQ